MRAKASNFDVLVNRNPSLGIGIVNCEVIKNHFYFHMPIIFSTWENVYIENNVIYLYDCVHYFMILRINPDTRIVQVSFIQGH